MSLKNPPANSLVLYKKRPALVTGIGEKIDLELEDGKSKRVRPKDIELLHPGPTRAFAELTSMSGSPDEAWELLQGERITLCDLAELIYGDYSPASAWAAWQHVEDGLRFRGSPDAIEAVPEAEVEAEQQRREQKTAEQAAWQVFVERIGRRALLDEDHKRLSEVERLALGHVEKSHIMRELGLQETVESAHRLLLKVGYWQPNHNPFPQRFKLNLMPSELVYPALPSEERLDLTHLRAYAIDDEESRDPDDAISIDGDRIWVHVADAAALVTPGSDLDQEAQARGASIYLPEKTVPMLPQQLTDELALGLAEISPALSIGFSLDDSAMPVDVTITPSTVRVRRLSYAEADDLLDEPDLKLLLSLSQRFRERRLQAGAAAIDLPEVKVRLLDGRVAITPLPALSSREMVTDLMLMAGEAVAGFCLEKGIAIPFATQAPPDKSPPAVSMAAMYDYRRYFKPSRLKIEPELHASLGLERYCRSTSPMRRYSDLLVHQQLRAYLKGEPLLDEATLSKQLNIAQMASAAIRKTERFSNEHWKRVFLQENPDWQGEGVVVAMEKQRATVLIPDLALEEKVRLQKEVELDGRLQLAVREVNLIEGRCYFRVL